MTRARIDNLSRILDPTNNVKASLSLFFLQNRRGVEICKVLGTITSAILFIFLGSVCLRADDGKTQVQRAVSLLSRRHGSLHSSIHCVGKNFGPHAWMYRSCQFRNLCFDISQGDFIVLPSPEELKLQAVARQMHPTVTLSSVLSSEASSMALGSLNSVPDRDVLRWFPRVVEQSELLLSNGFYELPKNVVFIPFHSRTDRFMWDDLFSIFVLLEIFGLAEKDILPTMHKLSDEASPLLCGQNATRESSCDGGIHRLVLSMLDSTAGSQGGIQAIVSMDDFIQEARQRGLDSSYICAPHAVAGIGMFANDASDSSSFEKDQRNILPNGHNQQGFSKFLLHNMGLTAKARKPQPDDGIKLTIAWHTLSSGRKFDRLKDLIVSSLHDVAVELWMVENMPLREQAKKVVDSDLLIVNDIRDAKVAALFLQPGSSIFMLHDRAENNSLHDPFPRDFDRFRSRFSHLRVHLISVERSFVNTMRHEVDLIRKDRTVDAVSKELFGEYSSC